MRTTIDAAGRIVVPKALRDAMGLSAGRPIDVVYVDGHIEIDLAAIEVEVNTSGELPVLQPHEDLPPLTEDLVRETLDATRR